ncbi:MAG: HlyU family transcriptional regulator [Pseudomonadota bacterium]
MSLLSRLFGGGSEPSKDEPAGEEYAGFTVYVAPQKDAGGYRVAARIEKDGRVHQMIRADVVASLEEAQTTTLLKAKALIDQQGERIF